MKIEKFEDIQIWQRARELSLLCYKIFGQSRDFGFRDQIQRAAVSVMNNVAEGFERMGNKEFRKFLFISKGSCGEVRSMLYLALDLNYISKNEFEKISSSSIEISRMLGGLIKKIKT
ncbi:four helix bundle protein [Candidatus Nomurabacteria bacterium RIFCSPLOWO2_01_FULL_46_18]|uniref:Four helix bundle protein n=1 Tax=Candidatus Nomurabacteria bacterium RIFCSPLOWO2_01_FULL_46_18 TaxID=1801783 RepID=A0A1F6XF02_9BACT|nr:MAG: four helix bundle protein [Candidatus Nomurabacteria bacterium RIFCSPLOWO2_01_FULL_46_18]